jgi:hypothetical protein
MTRVYINQLAVSGMAVLIAFTSLGPISALVTV